MRAAWAWSLLRGLLLGGAVYALVAHLLLYAGASVSRLWLPLCVAASMALGLLARRRRDLDPVGAPPPRWLLWSTMGVVVFVAVALAYGSVATSDRAWDGVVAWGLKAAALTADPTLDQPYFADIAVRHHSPDYPLLQPLLLAGLAQWLGEQPARLLFPLLWLLFVATGGLAMVRRSGDRTLGYVLALCLATTPFFVNTSGGGADSGYAEMMLALALIVAAAALLLGDAVLLGAMAMVLPWIKPEGTAALLACFVMAPRRLWFGALLGGLLAMVLWLPLQLQLGYQPAPGPWLPIATLSAFGLAAGCRALLDGRRFGVRGRSWSVLTMAMAGALALVVAQPVLAAQNSPLLAQYLGDLARIGEKLGEVPAIVWGLVDHALRPNRFGLTFVVLGIAAIAAWRQHRRGRGAGVGALLLWLGFGLGAVFVAFLLSPEADVQHHLRSSASRLLSHWVGVAWLISGAVWFRARSLTAASASRGLDSGSD